MKTQKYPNRSIALLLFILITSFLNAQEKTPGTEFTPEVGQPGKDVIWVPTPDELTVIAAAKLGARAIGIEYNPEMVDLSNKKAELAGVKGKASFIKTDLFEYDLSEATVITMFLLPDINLKLRPKLLDLKPGTRIVSNTFTMGDWEPDFEVITDEESGSWYTALMWIIPAKIDGTWKLASGELTIRQEFQMFYGTLKNDKMTANISDGRITGDTVNFRINGDSYTGKVTGNTITGTFTAKSTESDWSATRQ